jgi:2'-5' RNA ligase
MAFPAAMPASVDDCRVIQEHDWVAFRELDTMYNHWQRPGWSPARRSYHWMLTFPDNRELMWLARRCQRRFADLGALDLVAPEALHITIGRVGFTDEVSATVVDAVVCQARGQLAALGPFDLSVGPLSGSSGALRFSVGPWRPLLNLHSALARATVAVLGSAATMNTSGFRPHLSIAYANSEISIDSLSGRISAARTELPISLPVGFVVLVELRREGHSYRYQELTAMPLQ